MRLFAVVGVFTNEKQVWRLNLTLILTYVEPRCYLHIFWFLEDLKRISG